MSEFSEARPSAVIFGCAGPVLLDQEIEFFQQVRPLGFILFARNCETPAQIRTLATALRATVGRPSAPVLIDQEGGRVQRLRPPHWRDAPAAAPFGALAETDPEAALRACRLNARLIGHDLTALGIDVDCLPCLDLRHPTTHAAIGDRAFSDDPDLVAELGQAQADGLAEAGVLAVMKHLPGHGRAAVDSHHELPLVSAGLDELRHTDFSPFRALNHLSMAMTGHLLFPALDDANPVSWSRSLITDVIRGEIGFAGLLMSDDIGMQALRGDFSSRAEKALQAGCDLVLHCSGQMAEMQQVAQACTPLTDAGLRRWNAVEKARRPVVPGFEPVAAATELSQLLART